MKVPLSQPDLQDPDIEAVLSVLRSTRLSIGPRQEEFEALFSEYIGLPYAVAVSSGTAGLHLALLALGIGAGDEVILPSFTFIAAANAVCFVGAKPVFVDIEAATLNLDPARVEAAITPRTRAILVVHTFGRPAPMDALLALARKHRLRVIEDACEALGAEYQGKKAGSFADASVFAFYPNKQITTGEGGMVLTPHPEVARECRALRNQGRYDSREWLEHGRVGYNYRLSEMACALGCSQMRRLESMLAAREAVAGRYHQRLRRDPRLILPPLDFPGGRMSWFVYVVRLADTFGPSDRDTVYRLLHAAGIGCARYFAPVHLQPAYRSILPAQPLPTTEHVGQRTLALPFYNRLSEAEMDLVCLHLQAALDQIAPRQQ